MLSDIISHTLFLICHPLHALRAHVTIPRCSSAQFYSMSAVSGFSFFGGSNLVRYFVELPPTSDVVNWHRQVAHYLGIAGTYAYSWRHVQCVMYIACCYSVGNIS